MNKMIVGNALSASLAMVVGFYAGIQWHDEDHVDGQSAALSASVASPSQAKVSTPVELKPDVVTVSPFAAAQPAATKQMPARPPVTHEEKTNNDHESTWEPVVSGFDRTKLEETYQQIYSEDANQRHQALRTLAQLGAEEIKPDLIRIALDEDESSEVRRDLIQQIDWSGNTQELADILMKSRDSEARLAAVTAASGGKLTSAEQMNLENAMLENLHQEPEDGIKIATLNHFLSTDPIAFEQIVEQYPNEMASPEVQSYLDLITTPPEQAAQAPYPIEGSGG